METSDLKQMKNMPDLDSRTEKYTATFARLIQEDTTTVPPDSRDLDKFYKFRKVLDEVFPNILPLCEYEDFDGSILLKWKGADSGKKPVMFLYHHDVVPADASKWSHGPFSGDVADGKLWGRGTLDTKCGLWAVLTAADELVAEGFTPDRDIYFASTRNEESSGLGATAIITALTERGIVLDAIYDEGGFILPDSIGCTNGVFAMVAVGEKIPTIVKFIAKGPGGHASMPKKNSPLVRLSRLLVDIEKNDPFPMYISDTACQMLRCMAPYMNKHRFIMAHPKIFAPLIKKLLPAMSPAAAVYFKSTLAFTMAGGSAAMNVIPNEAWIVGNMRTAPHQTPEECIAILQKICDKYDIQMEYKLSDRVSRVSDYRSEPYKIMEAAIKEAYGDKIDGVVPYVANASTDSGRCVKYCEQCIRIDPFLISKAQRGTIHAVDENIDISTLVPAVDCFRYVIKNL